MMNHLRLPYARTSIPAAFFLLLVPGLLSGQEPDVPFVGTPPQVVQEMLDLAAVGPGDYLIDLGAGDGRIVIAAARRGAAGHGVEIDPELVHKATQKARNKDVDDRVMFLREDIFSADFSMASVITLYMSQEVNLELRPDLLQHLKPGTRVVSHIFDMGDWKPDLTTRWNRHNIYLWIVPADVRGEWTWTTDENTYTARISQNFQNIRVTFVPNETGRQSPEILTAGLRGEKITLVLRDREKNRRIICTGTLRGDTLTGTLQFFDGGGYRTQPWKAGRK